MVSRLLLENDRTKATDWVGDSVSALVRAGAARGCRPPTAASSRAGRARPSGYTRAYARMTSSVEILRSSEGGELLAAPGSLLAAGDRVARRAAAPSTRATYLHAYRHFAGFLAARLGRVPEPSDLTEEALLDFRDGLDRGSVTSSGSSAASSLGSSWSRRWRHGEDYVGSRGPPRWLGRRGRIARELSTSGSASDSRRATLGRRSSEAIGERADPLGALALLEDSCEDCRVFGFDRVNSFLGTRHPRDRMAGFGHH